MARTLRVIFVKEFQDLIRDRRAMFFLIIPPILLPLMAILGALIIGWQVTRQAPEGLSVAVVGGEYAPELVTRLEEGRMLHIVAPPAEPAQALARGDLMVLLVIPPNTPDRIAAELPVTLTLTTSRVGWIPSMADLTVREIVQDYSRSILQERLARHSLEASWMTPLRLAEAVAPTTGIVAPTTEVSGAEPVGRSLNGLILPFLVASWSMGGGLSLIAHMTVGEKEQNTMEPLLATAASRVGIVLGKIFLSMIISLISIILWAIDGLGYLLLVNLTATASIAQPLAAVGLQAQAFGLSGIWILLLMLPLMTMLNGLTAAICTFARNFREASLFLTVLQLGLPALSFAASFIAPAHPSPLLYALPFFGILIAVRDLFLQGLPPEILVLTIAASIIYAILSILLAAYVFSREWALMRGL